MAATHDILPDHSTLSQASYTMLRWITLTLFTLLVSACGFHLAKEAQLPASMQRLAVQGADPYGALLADLGKALQRSGVEMVEATANPTATLRITSNELRTDVLSVGGNARANEYVIRHHLEFNVTDGADAPLLGNQVIELSRDFTFDASQALGIAAQQDLLTEELRRDMVQAILRKLEASHR